MADQSQEVDQSHLVDNSVVYLNKEEEQRVKGQIEEQKIKQKPKGKKGKKKKQQQILEPPTEEDEEEAQPEAHRPQKVEEEGKAQNEGDMKLQDFTEEDEQEGQQEESEPYEKEGLTERRDLAQIEAEEGMQRRDQKDQENQEEGDEESEYTYGEEEEPEQEQKQKMPAHIPEDKMEEYLAQQEKEAQELIDDTQQQIADEESNKSDKELKQQRKNMVASYMNKSKKEEETKKEEEESYYDEEGEAEQQLNDADLTESEKQRKQRAHDKILQAMPTKRHKDFTVNFTVGRIEDGNAILLSQDHNLIDVPLMLLPKGIKPGNILKFQVERNLEMEAQREREILSIQDQILNDPRFFSYMQ